MYMYISTYVNTLSPCTSCIVSLLTAREVEKYIAIHRKGHRKPRLSEPLLASLKQNVHSPIRIIRPSPTPISPSYKAKAQTNVSVHSLCNPYACTVLINIHVRVLLSRTITLYIYSY